MKFIPVWFVIAALPSLAADPQLTAPVMPLPGAEAPAKGDKESGRVVFTLVPRAFQKEPLVDFNVLTEMTPEGRKRPEPTAESPQYCMLEGGGMKDLGESVGSVKEMTPAAVHQLVARSLEKRNYRIAGEGDPRPTLVIVYHWGAHETSAYGGSMGVGTGTEDGSTPMAPSAGGADDMMLRVLGDMRKRKILIDRAALVGGAKFSMELNAAMNEEAAFRRANDAAARLGQNSIMDVDGPASPFQRFRRRDDQTNRLVEEAFGSLYFVVISAFDYDSVAASTPILLWRTKMSVNSDGISLVETIQPMILAGRNFIGKETDGGILLARRIKRGENVKIGEAEVEEYLDGPKEKGQKPAERRK
jgi:hypothetical protein